VGLRNRPGGRRAPHRVYQLLAPSVILGNLVGMVLAVLGGVTGLMSVALLAVPGGPQVTPSTSLFDVLGYLGLFLATVLILRALVAVMRD